MSESRELFVSSLLLLWFPHYDTLSSGPTLCRVVDSGWHLLKYSNSSCLRVGFLRQKERQVSLRFLDKMIESKQLDF